MTFDRLTRPAAPALAGLILAGLALLPLAGCGDAGTPPSQDPAQQGSGEVPANTVWAHEASDLTPDPRVIYGQLKNGLRYALMANDTPTDTAAVRLRVAVGALHEPDGQETLAHFLEHMAFNGSQNVPEGEMVKILERNGLAFGADTNAGTGLDETTYQLNLPSASTDLLNTAFFLMREVADRLTFEPDAIDRERGIVESEARVRNTWQRRYIMDYYQTLAPDTRIGFRLDDKPEAIASVQQTDFKTFYEAYYRPERAFLVVVGDFDPAGVEAKIAKSFGDWDQPGQGAKPIDFGSVDESRPLTTGFFQDPDVPTIATIAVVRNAVKRADTIANRRRETLRLIGNSIVSRRLATIARQADAPFLQGSASYDNLWDIAEEANIQVISQPDDWQRALATGEQELRRALEFGFSQAELNEQVANLRTALKNRADRRETRQTRGLASGLVSAFGGETVFTDPVEDYERFLAYEPEITPDAVAEVFRSQWEGVEPFVHLAHKDPLDGGTEDILAAFRESQAVAVEAPAEQGDLVFAYTDFGTPGEVVSDTRMEDPEARLLRFDNNLLLTVKKTDFEDDVIRISVRVGGGLLELPKDKPGLSFLIDSGFVSGGLEAHSFDDIERLTAGRTVRAGFGTGSDAFGGRFSTTAEDLDLQLQLITAYLTAPGFRPEGETQFRQLMNVIYETLDATPQGIYRRDVSRLIRGGDPRFGWPEKDVLLNRSFEEIKTVTARAMSEGLIEMAVVGDIEEQTVIDAVARTLGALPDRRDEPLPFAEARQIAFPGPSADTVIRRHNGEPDRALALVFWPTRDRSDAQAARTLRLLNGVFRLKLIDKIREEIGATYSPSSRSVTSLIFPGYGYLSTSLDVEPGKVDAMFALTDEMAASMAAGEISADELTRALKPILEDREEGLESNGFWLSLLSDAQTKPSELDRFRGDVEGLQAVTLEDLKAAAALYMQPDRAYRVAILPPESGPETEAEAKPEAGEDEAPSPE